MREIKFRAWNKADKTMIKNLNSPALINGVLTHDYDDILMQFTGLQDKNGVDIYDGDVVSNDVGVNFTVSIGGYFSKDSAGNGVYYYQIGEDDYWAIESNPFGKESEFEVIGNIHQNPELLE